MAPLAIQGYNIFIFNFVVMCFVSERKPWYSGIILLAAVVFIFEWNVFHGAFAWHKTFFVYFIHFYVSRSFKDFYFIFKNVVKIHVNTSMVIIV